jgi:hypothetical protein
MNKLMSTGSVYMKKILIFPSLPYIILATLAVSHGCTKQIHVSSRWHNHAIAIEGTDDEWGSATIYATKAKVSLTLLNDSNDIYIRLCSRDRDVQAHVLGLGLTVWFDPDGGKNKAFGIHFPLGRHETGMPPMSRKDTQHPEDFQKMIEKSTEELEILYPDKEACHTMLLSAAEVHGISAALYFLKGNLVYELKVPLVRDEKHQHAIGISMNEATTGAVLGVGFETPEIDLKDMQERREGEGAGEMPPAEGSGMPPAGTGRMPSGGPPDMSKTPERIDLWISVALASKPTVHE